MKDAWDLYLEIRRQEQEAKAEYVALALSMGVECLNFDTPHPRHSSTAHLDAEQLRFLALEYGRIADMSLKALIALRVDSAKADQIGGLN